MTTMMSSNMQVESKGSTPNRAESYSSEVKSATSPCRNCLNFLKPENDPNSSDGIDFAAACPICLGLWQDDKVFQDRLEDAIRYKCKPYGNNNNRFSSEKDSPVVSLPGDVVFRYHMASSILPEYRHAKPLHVYLQQLKYHVSNVLNNCTQKLEKDQSDQALSPETSYPECVSDEEQGYLAMHVLLAPSSTVARPSAKYLPKDKKKKNRRKHFETQGGHPRENLERQLQIEGAIVWPINHAVELSGVRKTEGSQKATSDHDWFFSKNGIQTVAADKDAAMQIHVALWRRPFLVQGNYTKARRDVSQTPFFVNADNPQKRQRLGITSIEEQILPALTEICGGIATHNNSPDCDNVLYGKAKFHASGREDMDVMMILPPHATCADNAKNISGRPFCCEVIDALRMPSVEDLKHMVHAINHTAPDVNKKTESDLLPPSNHYYGRNPFGVGVDPETLSFAPGDAFKNLQSETEKKHKYYGCLCWSQKILPPQDELQKRLTTSSDGKSLFPLELKQRTPIRVLHRRANSVRIRHVMSCPLVERLDDHYFRIHISTDAGTYVKEYCHGDLGRTQPNLSSLLGCGKTDILELDCEGIQIN